MCQKQKACVYIKQFARLLFNRFQFKRYIFNCLINVYIYVRYKLKRKKKVIVNFIDTF
jgi:hypothetical protein